MIAAAELYEVAYPYLVSGLLIVSALLGSAHVILNKRDALSAFAWVGVIWLVPLLGVLLYALFGINRIRRRAQVLRQVEHEPVAEHRGGDGTPPPVEQHLRPLVRLVDRVVHLPLVEGNRVRLLANGDEAFPEMLAAIDAAKASVSLTTYIFDNDRAGRQFSSALARAKARGVAVRVLIDGVGNRYSWPPMHRRLEREGIRVAQFLPTLVPWYLQYVNLRNHRKILVVDGAIGFTGGMNIREGNLLSLNPEHPIRDLHARLDGPVVAHLQRAFVEDWEFATGESLQGEAWFPPLAAPAGDVIARGIPDGPDENFEVLRMILLGALASARSRVQILTPYFVPDGALITALNVAAMRGVDVDIVLPARGNLVLVQWASLGTVEQVLERGCRVWLTPPPFDHGKLMVVDGVWTLIGSANWDTRALRLNFEFDVECFDRALAGQAGRLIEQRIDSAHPLTLEDIRNRSLAVRLRDGAARLLSPYL